MLPGAGLLRPQIPRRLGNARGSEGEGRVLGIVVGGQAQPDRIWLHDCSSEVYPKEVGDCLEESGARRQADNVLIESPV